MATSNPLDILLTQDRWASRQMLLALDKLSNEQLRHPFPMGPGSLLATMTHLVASMRAWGNLLAGREQRPRLEQEAERTPQELLAIMEEVADDMAAVARSHPVDESVTGSRGGKTYTFQRGAVLTHVATHGMHHRAQCLNMLRQLGVTPLPPSSVLEWILMVDSPIERSVD